MVGFYIELRAGEPPTKLAWLEANGREVTHITAASPWLMGDDATLGPEILVAYTRTGFEAAALMFSTVELKRYRNGRPDARWFRVPLAKLPRETVKNIGRKAYTALTEWEASRA